MIDIDNDMLELSTETARLCGVDKPEGKNAPADPEFEVALLWLPQCKR